MARVAATMAAMKNASLCHQVLGASGVFWTTASDMISPLKWLVGKYRRAFLALSMAPSVLHPNAAPIIDSIRLSAAVLVKGGSPASPPFSGEWGRLPPKKLPASISVFLKPSQAVD